jgi:glutamyl-tRNA synthetase
MSTVIQDLRHALRLFAKSPGFALTALPSFTAEPIEACVRGLADARGVKPASLIHATRLAVTGRGASPGLFEVLELVGRDRSVTRLRAAAAALPIGSR